MLFHLQIKNINNYFVFLIEKLYVFNFQKLNYILTEWLIS